MKKLLNTLYVTTPDVYLSLDGENIVLLQEQSELGRVPLQILKVWSASVTEALVPR